MISFFLYFALFGFLGFCCLVGFITIVVWIIDRFRRK